MQTSMLCVGVASSAIGTGQIISPIDCPAATRRCRRHAKRVHASPIKADTGLQQHVGGLRGAPLGPGCTVGRSAWRTVHAGRCAAGPLACWLPHRSYLRSTIFKRPALLQPPRNQQQRQRRRRGRFRLEQRPGARQQQPPADKGAPRCTLPGSGGGQHSAERQGHGVLHMSTGLPPSACEARVAIGLDACVRGWMHALSLGPSPNVRSATARTPDLHTAYHPHFGPRCGSAGGCRRCARTAAPASLPPCTLPLFAPHPRARPPCRRMQRGSGSRRTRLPR